MFKYRNIKQRKNSNTKTITRHRSLGKDQRKDPQPISEDPGNTSFTQQTQQSAPLSKPLKQLPGPGLRKVFMVFSRMHWTLKLRHRTLFLAFELYRKYMQALSNPEDLSMPIDSLVLVCAYLAMKYEEIYPPTLKYLFPFVKSQISMEQYIQYEVEVLKKLNANLAMPTAFTKLEEVLKDNSDEVYNHAYYLMELAFFDPKLLQEHSVELVCQSIVFLMLPLRQQMDAKRFGGVSKDEIQVCAKKLAIAKYVQGSQISSLVSRKYASSRFMSVAECQLPTISRHQ